MKQISIIFVLCLLVGTAKAREEGARFETLEAWKTHVTNLVGNRFSVVNEIETEDFFFLILRDPGAFLICDLPRGDQADRPSFESVLRLADGSDPVIGWQDARRAYKNVRVYDSIETIREDGRKSSERYYHGELLPVRSGILTEEVIVIFRTLDLKIALKDATKSETTL